MECVVLVQPGRRAMQPSGLQKAAWPVFGTLLYFSRHAMCMCLNKSVPLCKFKLACVCLRPSNSVGETCCPASPCRWYPMRRLWWCVRTSWLSATSSHLCSVFSKRFEYACVVKAGLKGSTKENIMWCVPKKTFPFLSKHISKVWNDMRMSKYLFLFLGNELHVHSENKEICIIQHCHLTYLLLYKCRAQHPCSCFCLPILFYKLWLPVLTAMEDSQGSAL